MKRALVLVGIALLVAGCGGGGKKAETSEGGGGGSTTVAGQSANDHGTKDVSGASSVEVEMDDFYFSPTVLKGTPGQKLTLQLHNEGKVEHNLTVESRGIDRDVEAGDSATVQVTMPKSGIMGFYCKYHRSMGMAGGLQTSGSSSGGSSGSTGSTGSSGY